MTPVGVINVTMTHHTAYRSNLKQKTYLTPSTLAGYQAFGKHFLLDTCLRACTRAAMDFPAVILISVSKQGGLITTLLKKPPGLALFSRISLREAGSGSQRSGLIRSYNNQIYQFLLSNKCCMVSSLHMSQNISGLSDSYP